ncbi:MAG: helix-turn-helix transcriptional regulator [Clostridia bacterium]|nr:helix-turn-helix transcriptional regulator [Clostridia bacterium]
MSKLQKRLQEFMRDEELSQTAFAKLTGIFQPNISDYINLGVEPNYDNFIKLINAMNCSADYALGLTDIDSEETFLEPLPFGARLREILNQKGISQERLKRELSISGSLIYKWLSGKSLPYPSSLMRLAKYLDCSVDYLLGRLR